MIVDIRKRSYSNRTAYHRPVHFRGVLEGQSPHGHRPHGHTSHSFRDDVHDVSRVITPLYLGARYGEFLGWRDSRDWRAHQSKGIGDDGAVCG